MSTPVNTPVATPVSAPANTPASTPVSTPVNSPVSALVNTSVNTQRFPPSPKPPYHSQSGLIGIYMYIYTYIYIYIYVYVIFFRAFQNIFFYRICEADPLSTEGTGIIINNITITIIIIYFFTTSHLSFFK